MNDSEAKNSIKDKRKFYDKIYFILALISVLALIFTFLVASADLTFQTKTVVFLAIILLYLSLCAFFYKKRNEQVEGEIAEPEIQANSIFTPEIESKLLALEEASQFFGASLKPDDMFRLVASRVNEIIPCAACVLFLADEEDGALKSAYAVGENAEKLKGVELKAGQGLAGKVLHTPVTQTDKNLRLERSVFSPDALRNLQSAIAAPLLSKMKVFGVLTLYGKAEQSFDENSTALLEAAAERITPLFLGSFAFEKNLMSALTDTLTDLPNERAFFMVLENQIAESQRYREMRPLTILSIDIKNFNEINRQFGHNAGDRILAFAAQIIKGQLRQMDFLARAAGDEFLAVLPTASDEITQEIVGRVRKAFVLKPFEVSEKENIHLELNFGAASFWKDGETPQNLLKHALLRKKQSKNTDVSKVLWFPREFVN